jgi:hypothetical protein
MVNIIENKTKKEKDKKSRCRNSLKQMDAF